MRFKSTLVFSHRSVKKIAEALVDASKTGWTLCLKESESVLSIDVSAFGSNRIVFYPNAFPHLIEELWRLVEKSIHP